jgi:hypothetical protein
MFENNIFSILQHPQDFVGLGDSTTQHAFSGVAE